MSFAEFQASLEESAPPAGASPALTALWHDAREEWGKAHNAVQADDSPAGAWVHAYLHRKEGDAGNAGYWYARAGRAIPARDLTLNAEWTAIARELLAQGK